MGKQQVTCAYGLSFNARHPWRVYETGMDSSNGPPVPRRFSNFKCAADCLGINRSGFVVGPDGVKLDRFGMPIEC